MALTYAAAGYGVGLSVRAPGLEFGPRLQAIDLDDFPRLKIAAFWQEPLAVLPSLFLEEIRKEAQTQLSVRHKPKASRVAQKSSAFDLERSHEWDPPSPSLRRDSLYGTHAT